VRQPWTCKRSHGPVLEDLMKIGLCYACAWLLDLHIVWFSCKKSWSDQYRRMDNLLWVSYTFSTLQSKGLIFSFPKFSLPIGFVRYAISNPAVFLFLYFSYPMFQMGPYSFWIQKWFTAYGHMYSSESHNNQYRKNKEQVTEF
jgi:hypothetical protein